MRKEYIPNLITILRLILVVPVIASLLYQQYKWAFWLFIFTGLTDAIDGYLARRLKCITRWGSMVDPLADKLLILSTFISLAYLGYFPLWLLLLMALREIIIVSGGVIYHYTIGTYEFLPSRISKLNTFLQLILIVSIMFNLSYVIVPLKWLDGLVLAVCLTSFASLIDYIWVWGRRAWLHNKGCQI